jgi:hypothetical protein
MPRKTAILLLIVSALAAADVRGAIAASFVCGAPGARCGSALPKGAKCPNGPGWCQSGYFCGWRDNTAQPSTCLPVPPDCGKAGKDCCPSNTYKPHTKPDDIFNLKPFCTDGSYCFYFAPQQGLDNGDFYAGVKGALGSQLGDSRDFAKNLLIFFGSVLYPSNNLAAAFFIIRNVYCI